MMNKIILVRHVECKGNASNCLTGHTDFDITENGEKSIKRVTDEIISKYKKIDVIYSSPYKRNKKTVELISKICKIPIQLENGLCEMYFGDYDGMSWEEVNKINPKIKQIQIETGEISDIPNQETTEQTQERMYNTIKKIANNNKNKTIIISSHGVAIEAFLRKILNKPFYIKDTKLIQYNASINEIQYDDEKDVFTVIYTGNIEYCLA